MCKLLSNAVKVVGPATTMRYSRCNKSSKPASRATSAYKPSVGKNITAKSVVYGGATYFSLMVLASNLIWRNKSLRALSSAAVSAISCASCIRSYCSFGNFASIGNHTTSSALSPRPGSLIANSTMSLLLGTVLTFAA